MQIHLLLHNLGYVISGILALSLGTIVFLRGPKKRINVIYFLNNICITAFIIAYLLAVNASDPYTSRNYLILTLINLFTVCLTAHLAFVTFGKEKQQQRGLRIIYSMAVVLLLFFLTNLNRYVYPSQHLQIFPYFYNPGTYYWLFTAFFLLVTGYFFYFLVVTYIGADAASRNRIKYFALSFGWGYGIGSLNFLPVFGINVIDPVIPSLLGLYTIPLAYGALKYDLIELNVVAKNAAIYTFFTGIVGALIIGIDFLNNYLGSIYSRYPFWLLPIVSGVLVVGVCFFIWNKIREADILKYEFINNISHKFRTPLTHIRWTADQLRIENNQLRRNQEVEQIQLASMRLFELTNIVIDVARNENDAYQLHFENVSLEEILNDLYEVHRMQIDRKRQNIRIDIEPALQQVRVDRTRLQFAMQILFENAIIYTPAGGTIIVTLKKEGEEVVYSVRDTGIGIDPAELPHLFSKFYRAANARHVDTEGMGIGLFMTKNIIERHKGRIWVQSEGEGKGATFSFALPIARP